MLLVIDRLESLVCGVYAYATRESKEFMRFFLWVVVYFMRLARTFLGGSFFSCVCNK